MFIPIMPYDCPRISDIRGSRAYAAAQGMLQRESI